ncbi:hypothetical protein B0T10DRAFT_496490 [Thelonectria olida]|uniref:Uncharacterized protein n=1 Tax=Thelonectria olida TaxID=1576542 RepID=A0A9P8VX12_9HYPO|nr:hypothetical protein B0T10DRAFT_496490 [Thelonectria olida]
MRIAQVVLWLAELSNSSHGMKLISPLQVKGGVAAWETLHGEELVPSLKHFVLEASKRSKQTTEQGEQTRTRPNASAVFDSCTMVDD